jgi:hypothetical protein
VGSHVADERCLIENSEQNALTDSELPAKGDGFWYLVRGENASGKGPYGFEESHGAPTVPRESPTCP